MITPEAVTTISDHRRTGILLRTQLPTPGTHVTTWQGVSELDWIRLYQPAVVFRDLRTPEADTVLSLISRLRYVERTVAMKEHIEINGLLRIKKIE